MKKKKILTVAAVLVVYILLLLLLTLAESAAESPSIGSFFQALWYSFVTMTTVGYGDMFPVTVAGKLISVLFLLLSAGGMTALLGFAISWFGGLGLPSMRLLFTSAERYYIFNSLDSISLSLSSDLLESDPGAVCVFSSGNSAGSDRRTVAVNMSPKELLTLLKHRGVPLNLILTGPDAEACAASCSGLDGVRIFCRTEYFTHRSSPDFSYFSRLELCSSLYWQKHPLRDGEKNIALVGFGSLGRALIEEALVSCIASPVLVREYTVFGDGKDFLSDHPGLFRSVSIGKPSDTCDSLVFSDEIWSSSSALMYADRIIFCSDDENENVGSYGRLMTYFPVSAEVHLFSSRHYNGLPVFGSDREIFTADTVLNLSTEKTARSLHEIYRSHASYPVPAWEELSDFTRRSNMASAAHIGVKVRWLLRDDSLTAFSSSQLREAHSRFEALRANGSDMFRRIEHNRWVRFHTMYNWQYCEQRCDEKRLHPLLVPYEDLSTEEKIKDDFAWESILSLADYTDYTYGGDNV